MVVTGTGTMDGTFLLVATPDGSGTFCYWLYFTGALNYTLKVVSSVSGGVRYYGITAEINSADFTTEYFAWSAPGSTSAPDCLGWSSLGLPQTFGPPGATCTITAMS